MKKSDKKKISSLIDDGKELEAENLFITKYVRPLATRLQDKISSLIDSIFNRQVGEDELNGLRLTISGLIKNYESTISDEFSSFSSVYSKGIYKKYGISSPFVKRTIKNAVIDEFNFYTKDALSRTDSIIRSSIRKYQRDIMSGNLKIDAMVDAGDILNKQVSSFRKKVLDNAIKNNPQIQNIRKGNFIVYKDGSMHGINEYSNMSTRTTILNIDRTAVEIKSAKDNRRVVEFYMRDKRPVSQDREVCNSIMHIKIKGLSMLALDQGAADVLGIRTLEQAKTEDGRAFGPNCRHSIRPLSSAIYNEIEKLLFVAEVEVA